MQQQSTKQILISAGEASGDMHAANLIRKVKKISPDINFYGMGADLMRKAGAKIIVDANNLSVIALSGIFSKFFKILNAFRIMKNAILRHHPDLLILVDYPGFNLRLAKIAKKAGVKVLYFISPKVWAWNQKRVKLIKKYVDEMAVIFPFEVDFYNSWGIRATFVGNPLLEIVKPKLTRKAAYQAFNLNPKYKTIGLFPGSRKSEIRRLLPVMLKTAELLKKQDSNLQFLLPQASSITKTDLQPYLLNCPVKVQIIKNQNYDVMQVCDAIIAASGTATLEIALMGIPLVIIYKTSWLEYQIAKRLIKIPYIGLCNILAKKKIAQELIQDMATPKNTSNEIKKILKNAAYRKIMVKNFQEVKSLLQNKKQKNLAKLIVTLIGNRKL